MEEMVNLNMAESVILLSQVTVNGRNDEFKYGRVSDIAGMNVYVFFLHIVKFHNHNLLPEYNI